MGLDMYLFKVTRLAEEDFKIVDDPNFNASEDDNGITEIELSTPGDERQGMEDVMPYLHIVEKPCEFWDHDKLKEYFKVPADAHLAWSSICGGHYEWCFRLKEDKTSEPKEYKVSNKDIPENDLKKVLVTHMVKYGYCKAEEIAYWRKDYDLQRRLYDAYPGTIENCGYHKLNDAMISAIMKYGNRDLSRAEMMEEDNAAVFYHEWY